MVCIYCGKPTSVTNSRPQKRQKSVWRRRHCTACGAAFTSIEQPDYEGSLAFQISESHIMSFSRDLLFLSIYDACRHRPEAARDATALTATIMSALLRHSVSNGAIPRKAVIKTALDCLMAFDKAAGVHYAAYHPL